MKRRIVACAWALAIVCAAISPASAGAWKWGCEGKIGDELVVFNRYAMAVLPAKASPGPLNEVIHRDTIGKDGDDPSNSYGPAGINDGLVSPMEFKRDKEPNRKITLTETSSKKIFHKHKLICGRDEDTDIFKKVYSYQRNDEPARDITMQCMEYQLSTRGGRPCN